MSALGERRTIYSREVSVRQVTGELKAYAVDTVFGCTWKCDCGQSSFCQIGAITLDAVLDFAEKDFRGHCDRHHI